MYFVNHPFDASLESTEFTEKEGKGLMDCFDQFSRTDQINPQTINPAVSKVERDVPVAPVGIGCCLSANSPSHSQT